MTWRTWLIRGMILATLAAILAGVWWAHSYVHPDAVRNALINTLDDHMASVDVRVGSARMRVFGGISVSDLRITRTGESEPFFVAPTAVIFHDKEAINRGRLSIRKIELDNLFLRLECSRDGTWNVDGLTQPTSADSPVPTVVVNHATVEVRDHRSDGLPPFTLSDAKLTVLNDPMTMIRAEGHATINIPPQDGTSLGTSLRTAVTIRLNRVSGQIQAGIELPEMSLNPNVARLARRLPEDFREPFTRMQGRVGLRVDASFERGSSFPTHYEARLTLRDGKFHDPLLPWPLEKIDAALKFRDGRLFVES